MTTRADHIKQALLWEQVAKTARDRAATHREALTTAAHAELEQGTVPTWRLPDLATVSLPVSKESAVVSDPAALVEYCRRVHPTEVETVHQVRPAFLPALLAAVTCDGDKAIDGEGEVVPGLTVRPGGVPGSLSIRPASGVRDVLASEVGALVDAIGQALGEPAGGDEVPA